METSDLVLARGMRDTRATLARWGRQPLPVLGSWLAAAAMISLLLLALPVASRLAAQLAHSPSTFYAHSALRPAGYRPCGPEPVE